MKSIEIHNQKKIIITYEHNEDAQNFFEKLHPFDRQVCEVNKNQVTYNLKGKDRHSVTYFIVKMLLRKITYPIEDIYYEEHIGDFNDPISNRINFYIQGRVFRITPIHDNGVKGTYDFGREQYSHKLSLIYTRKGEFFINTRNRWFDDKAHTLDVSQTIGSKPIIVKIDIGEIQF